MSFVCGQSYLTSTFSSSNLAWLGTLWLVVCPEGSSFPLLRSILANLVLISNCSTLLASGNLPGLLVWVFPVPDNLYTFIRKGCVSVQGLRASYEYFQGRMWPFLVALGKIELYILLAEDRRIDKVLHKEGSPRSLWSQPGQHRARIGQWRLSSERLLLQLFYKVGLQFSHLPFPRETLVPSISMCYSVSQRAVKIMVITLALSFLAHPEVQWLPQGTLIATGFLLVSTMALFLTFLLPLDPVSPVQTWRGCERTGL